MNPLTGMSTFNRIHMVQQIEAGTLWDLVVIGGGATGLGIALEAVTRGYKTLLLEQVDFAKGTSGRSTKLVHGGVRYLGQGDVKLVREATIERGLLYRNAPHLVTNQQFVIPVYTHWDQWKYTVGLKLYDWISGSLSMGSSTAITRHETAQRIPGIQLKNLAGGVVYHDGQFDDARLALNLAQTIAEKGGIIANYFKVNGLLKVHGCISGVAATDLETGEAYSIAAKAVVNATGVFVDDILKMDEAAKPKTICVSQGVHLVFDKTWYPSANALMIPKTADGRVLFAVPWHNKVLFGTTDTPVEQPLLEPVALEKEIEFILSTAGQYLEKQPTRSDVLSVFAGLRPLAAPVGEAKKTREISRSHKIVISASGLFTILGGKWTTYRKMGEDMVSLVEKKHKWNRVKTGTEALKIHGYFEGMESNDPLRVYGSDSVPLRKAIALAPEAWISKKLGIHTAQVKWAVQHEMARTVEDVLSRRTRALLLDAAESIAAAPAVAKLMAHHLNHNEEWITHQVNAYTAVAKNYILK